MRVFTDAHAVPVVYHMAVLNLKVRVEIPSPMLPVWYSRKNARVPVHNWPDIVRSASKRVITDNRFVQRSDVLYNVPEIAQQRVHAYPVQDPSAACKYLGTNPNRAGRPGKRRYYKLK